MSDRAIEFADIYARHAADVFRFALRLTGDRSEAEDITSEAFTRALASTQPIRTATVKAYLFTIARRYYLETRRRSARHVPLHDAIRDARSEPGALAEQSIQLGVVSAALGRLPEIDRAAIVMRALHRLPYEEIARALGISVAAARVKVHRARLALSDIR
jgi:RNA polymerase sigma-70 factor (ECF subfamily)